MADKDLAKNLKKSQKRKKSLNDLKLEVRPKACKE